MLEKLWKVAQVTNVPWLQAGSKREAAAAAAAFVFLEMRVIISNKCSDHAGSVSSYMKGNQVAAWEGCCDLRKT